MQCNKAKEKGKAAQTGDWIALTLNSPGWPRTVNLIFQTTYNFGTCRIDAKGALPEFVIGNPGRLTQTISRLGKLNYGVCMLSPLKQSNHQSTLQDSSVTMQTTVGAQVPTSAAFDTQDDSVVSLSSLNDVVLSAGCY